MSKVSVFINDAVDEMRRVAWPTRKQAMQLSVMVLVSSAVLGTVLMLVDAGLSNVFRYLLN